MAYRKDPFQSLSFMVQVEETKWAAFSEVTGLEVETEVEKFREGGVNSHEWQLVGPAKFPSRLVLKRGMTQSTKLWSWYEEVMRGEITRKTVSIHLNYNAGPGPQKWVKKQRIWTFEKAVPVKWVGSQFRATANEVLIETLELVHQSRVRVEDREVGEWGIIGVADES